jgi:hypothetical protein
VLLGCQLIARARGRQIDGESKGPHLFWSRIAEPRPTGLFGRPTANLGTRPVPLPGVAVGSLPTKTALKGLDNATVRAHTLTVLEHDAPAKSTQHPTLTWLTFLWYATLLPRRFFCLGVECVGILFVFLVVWARGVVF